MKLIQLISRSPNNKMFLCRVKYKKGGFLDGLEYNMWVKFNTSQAVILDPQSKFGMHDLPQDRKRKSRTKCKVLDFLLNI